MRRYYPRPYRNRRRYYNYNSEAVRHIEARRALSSQVFGLDNEILNYLFKLSWREQTLLFEQYEMAFGQEAGGYARTVWEKWKSGKVRVSGMVAGRFINLAPKFISQNARYEIVAKLYHKTKRTETHRLTAILGYKEGAFGEIEQLFERLCRKPFEHEWPDSLLQFAKWLCDEDSEAAKRIITAIETEQSVVIVKAARLECNRLLQALQNLDSSFEGTHRINLPYGTISLHIRKPTLFEKLKKLLT